ncbi:MAG: septum formation protein Maf [Planctomycetes bacterium RBG_13_46_10]|nr:MAG: septum formation protein Maf [Planctomycetes bacterium RBG_13_46_10]
MSNQFRFSIILASASPRRKQLLAEVGYRFTTITPDIDESAYPTGGHNACEYAKMLALAKAKSVAVKHPDCLVIGADTVVDFDGEIIGKPADAKDAERITKKIFSKPHKVITGLAVVRLSDGIEVVESDTTIVYPKKMTAEQIAEHIKGGSWRDKAGAYAIQESGDEFVEKIEGSLTNVMGLPMELLQQLLKKFVG